MLVTRGCDHNISTICEDLWALLAVPSETKHILARGEVFRYQDLVDDVEAESILPKLEHVICIVLIICTAWTETIQTWRRSIEFVWRDDIF